MRMEYGSWEENRQSNLDWLARAGELCDVTILVEGSTFPAHRSTDLLLVLLLTLSYSWSYY